MKRSSTISLFAGLSIGSYLFDRPYFGLFFAIVTIITIAVAYLDWRLHDDSE